MTLNGDKDNHEDSDQKNHLHGFDQDAETMIKKVKQALANGEGCRVYGVLDVQRIFEGPIHVNVSHIIHDLSFGPKYPGIHNPLDETSRILRGSSGTFKYYMKYTYQKKTWPAVYFLYDLSPITVTIREERRSFLHFITRLCAVLGGTFALTGMLDRWMYRLLDAVMKPNARSMSRPGATSCSPATAAKVQKGLPRNSKGERELGQAKMNHNQQSSDGRHDDDTVLSDFLASLTDYTPTIPDQLVEHYLAKSGFQCPDVRLIRLVAVATQKFIAEVATDALQQCKARQAAVVKDKRDKQQKDLSKALREYGVNVKHQEYFADSPTAGLDPASRDE
ncbi:unnamed protein product [Camellia sinensis]